MGDKCKKLVKVDNWGMFFLQRLQQHFAKSEYCDFTLKFSNDQKIKAHRLVLDVCTEYFQMLEKQGLVDGFVISMPEDMQPDVVIPVINFMYTGRLEFHADIQARLYATAQKMKMTVLTKLLDAQSLNTQQLRIAQSKSPAQQQRASPAKRVFPPGTFTNLQGKRISPRVVDPNLPQMLPGRKLPIWTRRSIPQQSHTGSSYTNFDRPIRIITSAVDETPRPTRFEWPEDGDDNSPSPLTTTFEDISYESKPLMQLKDTPKVVQSKLKVDTPVNVQKRATFEDVLRTGAVVKRSATGALPVDAAKRMKTMNLQDVKDYVQEAQVRKNMVKAESDDEDVDNDLAMMDTDEDEDEGTLVQNVVPHKSILKTQSSHEEDVSNPSSKKVRFSLETPSVEEKENSTIKSDRPLPTRAASNISTGSTPHVTNHAKIITEVLKKYPHLVKNNKNIRLKIMQRGGSPQSPVEKDASGRPVKSKVSYVVLKSDASGAKGKSTLGIKHGGLVEQFSSMESQQKLSSGAENITGPWLCHTCGTNEEPVNFETYYEYRHHLQDVHMEKIDARICEHCGHRASKRNLLLYHLFTKHGVPPPRNCQFPKCDQCEYVALSESLLIKHRNNHSNNRDFACKVCSATFKSNGALQGHMQTNLHSDPYKKSYECPFCQKPFVRNINLKAHIRVSHKELAKRFGDEELDLDEMACDEDEGQVMEVPVIDMMNENAAGMTILAERSSEAEGLSHVASGIAASLGLADGQQAVIMLDDNQEFIIQTTEIVGNEYMTEESALVQEYIVPEMMNEEPMPQEGDQGLDEYTEEQPIHGQEEVLMILTDHCYAEEVVTKDEEHDERSHVIENGDMEIMDEHALSENQQEETNGQVLASIDDTTLEPNNVYSNTDTQALIPSSPTETYSEGAPSGLDIKGNFAKPPVEMSDLLGEWDEDLSQEADDAEGGLVVVCRQDALPTRDDIPRVLYSLAHNPPAVQAEGVAEVAQTIDQGVQEVEQEQTLVENYERKDELGAMQGTAEALTDEEPALEATLSVEQEQQHALLVDAEEMAHDSASLMAETGENNTLVMDLEMDSSFPQESEDTASFSEEMVQQASFAVESEQNAQFPVATSQNTQYPPEMQLTTSVAAGNDQTASIPIETDQNLQFPVAADKSAEFAAGTDQVNIVTPETNSTPSFLPYPEAGQISSFLPYPETDQNTLLHAHTDQPSIQFVSESEQTPTLSNAKIEHGTSTSIGAESVQHASYAGESEGNMPFSEDPEQSLVIADESEEKESLPVPLKHESSDGFDQAQPSVNIEILERIPEEGKPFEI